MNAGQRSAQGPGQLPPVPSPAAAQAAALHHGDSAGRGGTRGGKRRRRRLLLGAAAVLVLVLVAVGARVATLWDDVDSHLQRVAALTNPSTSDGETWLIVGSDEREGDFVDGTEGARSDSILLLNKAPNGQVSMVSLPRDTYVQIPDHKPNKINASYSLGGPQLLVQTVEALSGLTVDHYAQIGMGGVENLVDAVGGVNLCLDYDVWDEDSGLVWNTANGECQDVDGETALSFSRMRKSDPTGDIGRGLRQRQVISAVASKALSWDTITSFAAQDRLVTAGTGALTVDESSGVVDLGEMVLNFRKAGNDDLTGAPPISSLDYEPGGIGAAVLLKDTTAPDFFAAMRNGTLTPDDFND